MVQICYIIISSSIIKMGRIVSTFTASDHQGLDFDGGHKEDLTNMKDSHGIIKHVKRISLNIAIYFLKQCVPMKVSHLSTHTQGW